MDARLALQVLAILVLGLMCGSELNVAAFGHPTLSSADCRGAYTRCALR